MTKYKCFKSDFENLTKKINRITKKLNKNNLAWNFEKISETIEPVDIYVNDEINKCRIKVNTIPVEVVNYTFEMETLKLGDYTPIAILEHNVAEENIIHVLNKEIVVPLKYRTVKSICEHCNSDRQRNKTVLIQDQENNIKQIGTTCIKEYTGIDAEKIIAAYADIHDILLQDLEISKENVGTYRKYEKTIDYLTSCIQLINEKGYNKETTKFEAWEIAGTETQDNKYKVEAEKVISYFSNTNFRESQDFLNNIKIYLSNEYTKISGFVAYAYLAYKKQIERVKENKGQYIGSIGDKIEIEITIKNIYGYETQYGHTNIIVMEDSEGNIYKWSTKNNIGEIGEIKTIKATIKEHEEYNGQKQTVITRCKEIKEV